MVIGVVSRSIISRGVWCCVRLWWWLRYCNRYRLKCVVRRFVVFWSRVVMFILVRLLFWLV